MEQKMVYQCWQFCMCFNFINRQGKLDDLKLSVCKSDKSQFVGLENHVLESCGSGENKQEYPGTNLAPELHGVMIN